MNSMNPGIQLGMLLCPQAPLFTKNLRSFRSSWKIAARFSLLPGSSCHSSRILQYLGPCEGRRHGRRPLITLDPSALVGPQCKQGLGNPAVRLKSRARFAFSMTSQMLRLAPASSAHLSQTKMKPSGTPNRAIQPLATKGNGEGHGEAPGACPISFI